MSSEGIKIISECFIKPKYEVEESKQPIQLSPWDVVLLGIQYVQKGLLFIKPQDELFSMEGLLESLKDSLGLALVHFYPLAGQLYSQVDEDRHRSIVFIDPNKGPGVGFVHATRDDVHVSDILSPADQYTPSSVVNSFFYHNGIVNYEGHSKPLLTVQVTELVDGIFIGCSISHVAADATSFWYFMNVWSQIHRAGGNPISISPLPIHKRWIPEGYSLDDFYLPYIHPDEFIKSFEPPVLKERFFHFSLQSINSLKARANEEIISDNYSQTPVRISSFQSLISLVWRSIIRARGLDPSHETLCQLATNERMRLNPPLPQEYFGNAVQAVTAKAKAGELVQHKVGWATLLLNQAVAGRTEKEVRDFFKKWLESRFVVGPLVEEEGAVRVVSSPRLPMYETQFEGLGKPVAIRSGDESKFGGRVTAYPGSEGGGSVVLEINLPPEVMKALELDEEFMAYVSPPNP